jgi:hypothetical protein
MSAVKDAAQRRANACLTSPSREVAKIVRAARTEAKRWEFSFRFFRQLEKFGLDGAKVPNDWLISLLERLKSLSLEKIENILDNEKTADAYRFHSIDWDATNIPISRTDIDWVSNSYWDNPVEYPLQQLMLSTGTGRFAGFFDENWVFNIVLLDPLHNLQPSRNFGYAVDDCSPLTCELTQLQVAVQASLGHCQQADCGARKSISDALAGRDKGYTEAYDVLLIKVDDPQKIEDAKALMADGKVKDFADIFEHGLCSLA